MTARTTPELILHRGLFTTLNRSQPTASAVAIQNGRFLKVGQDHDVMPLAGPDTQVIDLRGKRVGFVVGSPALNQNALAVMAYGGLTRNDVRIVEFSSYGAMWKGLVNNEADAAFASTISGQAREVDSSPRGLMWPPTPTESLAWRRLSPPDLPRV